MNNLETLVNAAQLKAVQDAIKELDVEWLEKALEEMRSNHSRKDAMMVLNPNPVTAIESSELEAAKLTQLDLYIQCAKNLEVIRQAEGKVMAARHSEQQLKSLFGL